jgi:hypothetical protein
MLEPNFTPLSRNEQLVLYHLVRYPDLPDKEVLNKIGMKQSTYSTLKKKLAEEGYFYTSYTPIYHHLGAELLVVWYVTLNRKTRTEDRLTITRDRLLQAADILCIVSESNQAILISVSRNIAEHIDISDRLVQLYEEHDFLEDIHMVYFPFNVSSIFSFFDFAPMLNRIFQVEPEAKVLDYSIVDSRLARCEVKPLEMNELEKKVYLGLVRHPELSDSLLSSRIGCSRQVFTRIKQRFLDEERIKKQRVVSLEKLGFRVLAMIHSRFNPLKPIPEREICVQRLSLMQTPVFNVARNPESVMLVAFRNFEEFKSLHNEFVSFCTQHDTLRGEPATLVLSIPRIFEIKWLVYEPLVRKILEGA